MNFNISNTSENSERYNRYDASLSLENAVSDKIGLYSEFSVFSQVVKTDPT